MFDTPFQTVSGLMETIINALIDGHDEILNAIGTSNADGFTMADCVVNKAYFGPGRGEISFDLWAQIDGHQREDCSCLGHKFRFFASGKLRREEPGGAWTFFQDGTKITEIAGNLDEGLWERLIPSSHSSTRSAVSLMP